MEPSRRERKSSVVAVRGGIVDMRFQSRPAAVYSLLRTGKNQEIAIEVLSQLDARRVRGIA